MKEVPGEGVTRRRCSYCRRTDVWMKPDRKILGERAYRRAMARQKRLFGSTDGKAFPQWISVKGGGTCG